MARPGREPILLPAGTVDLHTEVVPAVRALLRRGLDPEFMRACVRIGAFEAFGGGMKSDLVGGLRVDVNAALKVGDEELDLHRLFIDRVNRQRPRTFPTVLALEKLRDGRRLMFMQQLLGHETLLDFVYRGSTTRRELAQVIDRVFGSVRGIRRAGREQPRALRRIPHTADPYVPRLRERLDRVFEADPELAVLRSKPGAVDGMPLPSLDAVLDDLSRWMPAALRSAPRALCHGDLHLGNVMARKRGRGFSVRLLDPNPRVGFTDPLHDAGKLLHWAEPLGWVLVDPSVCRATFSRVGDRWRLTTRLAGAPVAGERRRRWLEAELQRRFAARRRGDDATRRARLEVAVASAHVGLAALLAAPEERRLRRFALAWTLRALSRWYAAIAPHALGPRT